jgi:hypothetical protein
MSEGSECSGLQPLRLRGALRRLSAGGGLLLWLGLGKVSTEAMGGGKM